MHPVAAARTLPAWLAAACLVLASCAAERPGTAETAAPEPTTEAITATPEPTRTTPQATVTPETLEKEETGPRPGDGRPARATLSIPRLDLTDLVVEPYRGRTDDARGTEIQDAGSLASPHGPGGGTGPGGIGNYQVTGHRLSSTMPFRYLPQLRRGDRVVVEASGGRYVYRIVGTRETSFRSPESLRRQRAAVPGQPGLEPTRAMITLSTCATVEDHAAGNFWSDRFGNPEHRIDKIGELVASG